MCNFLTSSATDADASAVLMLHHSKVAAPSPQKMLHKAEALQISDEFGV